MGMRRPGAWAAVLGARARRWPRARADATVMVLSTIDGATLGGVTFRDGDLVRYDDVTDTATLIFDEDGFSANENIDALHVLANGNILLSTVNDATLGGLTFRDGDIVEYDR